MPKRMRMRTFTPESRFYRAGGAETVAGQWATANPRPTRASLLAGALLSSCVPPLMASLLQFRQLLLLVRAQRLIYL